MGKRIAALEARIGVPLFARGTRGLNLSVAGKEYLEQVRTALGLLSDVSLHRAAQHAERLRVVAPPTFSRQILVPYLGEFSSRHPEVELELVLSIPYLDLGTPEADLQIRFGQRVYTGLVSERLIEGTVFPVCAPSYLAKVKGLRQPADLARAALLRCPPEPWKPWFTAAGLDWAEPASGPRLVDLGLTLEAAVNAQGVTLARRSLARSWLASGTLRRLFDVDAYPESFYYLCRDASRPMRGAQAAFVEWLKGVCARLTRKPE